MTDLITNFHTILERIQVYEQKYHRIPGSVSLLAVSKTHAPTLIEALHGAGQQSFAENYLQEALAKISALQEKRLIWHYIGPVQSKKAKAIAQNFSWVQTVCRLKEAELLSSFRSLNQHPLNICIQIKLDNNPKKSGISVDEAPSLVKSIQTMPHLRLRGFMTILPLIEDFQRQREYYRVIYDLFTQLNVNGAQLDTLSMGMSHDFEAAIAEGATMIRIGTGLFGPRQG